MVVVELCQGHDYMQPKTTILRWRRSNVKRNIVHVHTYVHQMNWLKKEKEKNEKLV